MILFLGIQGTYQHVHVGLFKNNQLSETLAISNADASKQLIPTIDILLRTHNISLECLSFIAATQGPGPFTTLRTILTTVNGLSFSRALPLIGIDSLTTLASEWEDPTVPCTVVLLDAFNNDVYFYVHDTNQTTTDTTVSQPKTGYHKIDMVLAMIKQQQHKQIRFIGNAALIYQEKIEALFLSSAYFPMPIPTTCSLSYVGQHALQAWHMQQTSNQLLPLYLKKHQAEISNTTRAAPLLSD